MAKCGQETEQDMSTVKEAMGIPVTASLWAGVLKWALNQGPVTAILGVILGMLWFGGRYAIDIAIPLHLQAIQSGYDRQQKSHGENLERVITANEKSSAQLVEQMKDSRDTFRKSLESGFRQIIEESKRP